MTQIMIPKEIKEIGFKGSDCTDLRFKTQVNNDHILKQKSVVRDYLYITLGGNRWVMSDSHEKSVPPVLN